MRATAMIEFLFFIGDSERPAVETSYPCFGASVEPASEGE
jgi:hypothetical protein